MDRMILRLLLATVVVSWLLAGTQAAEPTAATSNNNVRHWIGQLGSDDYGTREEATFRLSRFGRSAVDAVTVAALEDDLEVSCRAIGVLQTLLSSEDLATEDAAADALTKIAETHTGSAADLAADALVDFQDSRQDRAIEELRRLGGTVVIGGPMAHRPEGIQVILGTEWRGGSADLKLLKRLPDLERFSVHRVAVTDDDLKQLVGLNQLWNVELFGSQVTVDGAARLAQMYPGIKVDRRSAAMLGVAGANVPAGCQIVRVEAGSAADLAGLMTEDIVVRFQDQAVPDFETLTMLIGSKNPGDKVVLELRRGEETIKKEVELGAWK